MEQTSNEFIERLRAVGPTHVDNLFEAFRDAAKIYFDKMEGASEVDQLAAHMAIPDAALRNWAQGLGCLDILVKMGVISHPQKAVEEQLKTIAGAFIEANGFTGEIEIKNLARIKK